ncbi:MAG: hypothetical protein JSV06_10605, partial [Myxococcales bacterium]
RAIEPELELLVMQCLEKKREDRPSSALEIAERLASLPIEPWTQASARDWWGTVGKEITVVRDRDLAVGSLATIQAGRMETSP